MVHRMSKYKQYCDSSLSSLAQKKYNSDFQLEPITYYWHNNIFYTQNYMEIIEFWLSYIENKFHAIIYISLGLYS